MLVDGAVVWQLHATHGLPLDVSIPILLARGDVLTWEPLLRAARADGADPVAVLDRCAAAVRDSHMNPDDYVPRFAALRERWA